MTLKATDSRELFELEHFSYELMEAILKYIEGLRKLCSLIYCLVIGRNAVSQADPFKKTSCCFSHIASGRLRGNWKRNVSHWLEGTFYDIK